MENYPKFLNKTGDVFVDFIIKQIIFHYNITILIILFVPSFIIFNNFCTNFILTFFICLLSSVTLFLLIFVVLDGSKFTSSDATLFGDSEYMKMHRKLNEIEDEK